MPIEQALPPLKSFNTTRLRFKYLPRIVRWPQPKSDWPTAGETDGPDTQVGLGRDWNDNGNLKAVDLTPPPLAEQPAKNKKLTFRFPLQRPAWIFKERYAGITTAAFSKRPIKAI
jgi:hypothetical protein